MNVLFVCHRFPFPPRRGGKIRPFNIIRHFHDQGHRVTVASLVRSEAEAAEGRGLADFCDNYLMERVTAPAAMLRMIARLPSSTPSSMGYFYSPRLARRIRRALADTRYDLVFVHCSSAGQYVEHVRDAAKILDIGDVDSEKWLTYSRFRRFPLSLGYRLEGAKLRREEQRLARHFDLCTLTTRAELETFDGFRTGVPSGWYPNGVDTGYFAPGGDEYDPDTICFVGRMDYYPNQQAMFDFCADVLPAIRARRPGIRLLIVGANPSRAVSRLGGLPGVTVTGSVPDVRPWVGKAALTVAPLSIARGTQNKILESMAMGVPVVSSREASGGIDANADEHLLVASTPDQYRDCVLRLLENPADREFFSRAGRSRVLSSHSWASSMRKLDGLVATCMDNAGRRKQANGS